MARRFCSITTLIFIFLIGIFIAGCGGNSTTASSNPPGTTTGSNPGTGGSGGGSGGGTTGSPEALFITNESSVTAGSNIMGFKVDSSGGQLTALTGSPFASQAGPNATATDPAGQFLFVSHNSAQENTRGITVYKIDASSAGLTVASEMPGFSGLLAVHPTGRFLYVTDFFSSSGVRAFTISSTGQLAPIAGSPFSTGQIAGDSITIDPAGRFLYVGSSGSDSVAGFSINTGTGALTLLPGMPQPVRASTSGIPSKGNLAVEVRFDQASGKFLYVGDGANSLIYTYAVDQNTGLIAKTTTVPSQTRVNIMRVTPNGKFLYATSAGGQGQIVGFAISAAGVLTPVPGSPVTVPTNPETFIVLSGLAVNNSSHFLYEGNNTGLMTGYSIDQTTGMLTQTGSPVNTGEPEGSISIAK